MFKLIPWKKRDHGDTIAVRHAEPSRQGFGDPMLGPWREEFDSLIDRFFENPWFGRRNMSLPSLRDVARFASNFDLGWEDNELEFVFHAELPGFEPEDFDVKVSGDTLTVRAEHKEETRDKKGGSSYSCGAFVRTLTLPHGVDPERINARYHSGVLTVQLPKTEQARGKRIPVSAN